MALCDESYQRVLRNNERKITDLTNLPCLLPILYAKGLLTEIERRTLQQMPEYEVNRSARLVQFLLSKGGKAFPLFIEALQEEDEHMGHKNLAVQLLENSKSSTIKTRTLSKKPPPPPPPRKDARVSHTQAPQPYSTPQPVRKQPLIPPKARSLSISEAAEREKILVKLYYTWSI